MNPEWRTQTVLDLCRAMRATRDYSATPILADALQDAGYDVEYALESLRHPGVARWRLERMVAVLYSDETSAAVERIAALAERMGEPDYPGAFGGCPVERMTYEELMRAATAYVETGNDGLGSGAMGWSNMGVDDADPKRPASWPNPPTADSGLTVEDQFWADWSLVTGRPSPEHPHAIFRCEC